MPWLVATEINKVMKTGAFGHICTRQTLPLREVPHDFWRYSADNGGRYSTSTLDLRSCALQRPNLFKLSLPSEQK